MTSRLSQGLYSFCPEIMLEGDDSTVFSLFFPLCELLKSSNVVSADEMDAAVEEYYSFIIKKRRQHEGGSFSACEIPDVVRYLVRDFSFQAFFRVFKLCCLIVGMPESSPPLVSMDLSGCAFSAEMFRVCLLLVQSYIPSWGYSHWSFFVESTLNAVLEGFANAGTFYLSADFNLWAGFCSEDLDDFLTKYRSFYGGFLLEHRKSCKSHYVSLNKANREARSRQVSVASESSNASSSVSKGKRPGRSKRSTPVSSQSKKNTTVKGGGGLSTSKKSKKDKESDAEDLDIVRRLKKTSNK